MCIIVILVEKYPKDQGQGKMFMDFCNKDIIYDVCVDLTMIGNN